MIIVYIIIPYFTIYNRYNDRTFSSCSHQKRVHGLDNAEIVNIPWCATKVNDLTIVQPNIMNEYKIGLQ